MTNQNNEDVEARRAARAEAFDDALKAYKAHNAAFAEALKAYKAAN